MISSKPVASGASGILLIDKAPGWTSHDAVARTRRLAGTRKVGHAGTLDPMATGLLVLGINSSTRLLTFVVGLDKEYLATIRLGESTTTDDAEGEVLVSAPAGAADALSTESIAAGIRELTGDISQRPSSVSAIKVDGKRAYARVRAGEEVELPSRPVTVETFELVSATSVDGFLDLLVRVECSSGTYIRALARDLGDRLGVGGHLTTLRRTRIGPFRVEDAGTLEEVDVVSALIGAADAAARLFPRLQLTEAQAIDLGHGKKVARADLAELQHPLVTSARKQSAAASSAEPVAALAPDGRLVGLVELRGERMISLVNFPPDEPAPETPRTETPRTETDPAS